MGVQDRDWYREDYNRREKEYDGDFSLHSKRVKQPAYNKNNVISKDYIRSDVLTIAVGVIIYLLLYSGKLYPDFWARIGIPYNIKLTAIVSAGIALLGIVLYAKTAKRRKHYDKSLMNVLALLVSIIMFTFFFVISIALAISSL